jgi:hypothetical protein
MSRKITFLHYAYKLCTNILVIQIRYSSHKSETEAQNSYFLQTLPKSSLKHLPLLVQDSKSVTPVSPLNLNTKNCNSLSLIASFSKDNVCMHTISIHCGEGDGPPDKDPQYRRETREEEKQSVTTERRSQSIPTRTGRRTRTKTPKTRKTNKHKNRTMRPTSNTNRMQNRKKLRRK